MARLLEDSQSALLIARVSRIEGSPQDDQLTGALTASAEAFLGLLQQLGEKSGHPELRDAPLLFWGFSRAQTGEFAPAAAFTGSKVDASWLPDELTARGWRAVFRRASESSR